jgi:biotin carboxylase
MPRLSRGATMPRPTLAIIEAGRSSAAAFEELHSCGEFFLLFVTRAAVPDAVRRQVDDVLVTETNDAEALVEALRRYTRRRRIDGAITLLEWYVPVTESVREALGLPGNGGQVALACRDKNVMRERLHANGVPVPRFSPVADPADLLPAVDAVGGFPCVLKPADGTGSTNVVLVESAAELQAGFARITGTATNSRGQRLARRGLVEQFVDGPEYAVDTLSVGGEHAVVAINEYTMSPLPYLTETGFFTPPALPASDADVVGELVKRAAGAVGITGGPAHCEVKWGPAGPVVIEIAARYAGAHLPELIRHTTGVRHYLEGARIACGTGALPTVRQRSAAALRHVYAGAAGRLTAVHGLDELRAWPGYLAAYINAAGTAVSPDIRDYTAAVGHVLFGAPTADEAMARAVAAARSLRLVIDTGRVRA